MLAMLLDRITPYLRWIAFAVVVAAAVGSMLLVSHCSGQRAAQSKQDARSAHAGTKTAHDTLDTLQGAQERDAATDRIVTQGKKEITDAPSDVEADAAARAALCRLQSYRDHAACRLPRVHP